LPISATSTGRTVSFLPCCGERGIAPGSGEGSTARGVAVSVMLRPVVDGAGWLARSTT
jgi:hypothetical protein